MAMTSVQRSTRCVPVVMVRATMKQATIEPMTPPWLAIPQLVLVLAWFVGCYLYVRHRERPAAG